MEESDIQFYYISVSGPIVNKCHKTYNQTSRYSTEELPKPISINPYSESLPLPEDYGMYSLELMEQPNQQDYSSTHGINLLKRSSVDL